MTDKEQITTLKSEHQTLEAKIENETRRPSPDPEIVNNLKREKLRIKDQLASLDAL